MIDAGLAAPIAGNIRPKGEDHGPDPMCGRTRTPTASQTCSGRSAKPAPRRAIIDLLERTNAHELALPRRLRFGGTFVTNAVPHVVAGMMGEPFQTPFAKPPGEGLSTSFLVRRFGRFHGGNEPQRT